MRLHKMNSSKESKIKNNIQEIRQAVRLSSDKWERGYNERATTTKRVKLMNALRNEENKGVKWVMESECIEDIIHCLLYP